MRAPAWADEVIEAVMSSVERDPETGCAVWTGRVSWTTGFPMIFRSQKTKGPHFVNVPQFMQQWVERDFRPLLGVPEIENNCATDGWCVNPDHMDVDPGFWDRVPEYARDWNR